MPEQFPYPENGWSTGGMRKVGEALESSAKRQRKRLSVDDKEASPDTKRRFMPDEDVGEKAGGWPVGKPGKGEGPWSYQTVKGKMIEETNKAQEAPDIGSLYNIDQKAFNDWLKDAPESTNIQDRRAGQTNADWLREMIQDWSRLKVPHKQRKLTKFWEEEEGK